MIGTEPKNSENKQETYVQRISVQVFKAFFDPFAFFDEPIRNNTEKIHTKRERTKVRKKMDKRSL